MKPFLVLSLSILALFPLYGQRETAVLLPSSYTVSLDFTMGTKYGQVEEIVYVNSSSDTKLSELLWDLKPLFYWGVVVDYAPVDPRTKGFFFRAALQAGLPGKTGLMEDRDWLAPKNALSHLSRHENYTEGAWFFDLTAGLSLPFFSKMWVQAYGALHYMNFYWVSRDGYKQYAEQINDEYQPWDPSLPKEPFFGPGIAYSQDWLIFAPGLSLHVFISKYLNAGLSFQISPLIMGVALDDHWQRSLQFIDSVYFGLFMEPQGELVFSPHERFDISLNLSYRFIRGSRGATRSMYTINGATDSSPKGGGASYYVLDGGLSLTVRF
ncbi:MAG: omptin family outer membrane protease [Spirochaetaceae bacterium]|jgi:outer membrane protease|nr:omptin family outer membrane protease [Spirochaetaceae bacterium]